MSYIKPLKKSRGRPRRAGVGAEGDNGKNGTNGTSTNLCMPVWAAIVLGGLSAWGIIRTIK